MSQRVVTVFGGSGFIGRHVVQRLAAQGVIVRVAVRDLEAAMFLKPLGDVGQVILTAVDIKDTEQVAGAVDGAQAVINLVGILSPWFKQTFDAVHVEGARNIATEASRAGVRHLVHLSAIGADAQSPALYGRTKAAGEEAVRAAFPEATIIRPSVVFGPEDNFFNMFAGMTRFSPVLPVFGCPLFPKISLFQGDHLIDVDFYGDGGTKFQPVYVGDVADAVMAALDGAASQGRTYELGGPHIYSFKALMELVLARIGRKRLLVPYPFGLAMIGAWFLEKLPNPLLTRDQLLLLQRDNVVGEGALTFADLNLTPTGAEAILPTYLNRFQPPKRQGLRTA